jgi:DNA-binding response OmpR family regulator
MGIMRLALVEDEKKLAEIVRKGLTSGGYVVDVFHDGALAEVHLLQNFQAYDLLILDLMLPRRTGLEVCASLRRQGVTTPVLILTAHSGLKEKVTALDAGADDFMAKPFDFDELFARIRALTRRPTGMLQVTLSADDLVLNPKTRTITRADQPIAATAKEFDILHLLLRNKGSVVTRETICQNIWQMGCGELSNVLDVHIRHLRSKIDDPYATKLLATVRGVGYTIKG